MTSVSLILVTIVLQSLLSCEKAVMELTGISGLYVNQNKWQQLQNM